MEKIHKSYPSQPFIVLPSKVLRPELKASIFESGEHNGDISVPTLHQQQVQELEAANCQNKCHPNQTKLILEQSEVKHQILIKISNKNYIF